MTKIKKFKTKTTNAPLGRSRAERAAERSEQVPGGGASPSKSPEGALKRAVANAVAAKAEDAETGAPSVHEHGYFRSEDGLRLFYSLDGPPGAPVLLFCYGIVCSTLQWKYQMRFFKKNYRVLYMDYRGHNNSETPEDFSQVTLPTLAKDLATLLTELKLGPVPVLGHSLGVNVALELYRLYPEKVAALVLASGTPRDPFETMFRHNFLQPVFELFRKAYFTAPEFLRAFWKFQGSNPINQEFIARAGFNRRYAKREDINEYLRITASIDLGVFMQLLHDFTRHNACHWLGDVKVPTLVVGGVEDKITPLENQKIMAKLIPGAELFAVPEGSHNAQMEFVELVNARIEKFLDRAYRTKPAGSGKAGSRRAPILGKKKTGLGPKSSAAAR